MSADMGAVVQAAEAAPGQVSGTREVLRRFLRHRLAGVGTVVLLVLVVACFGAGWLAPYEQGAQDLVLGPTAPSAAHCSARTSSAATTSPSSCTPGRSRSAIGSSSPSSPPCSAPLSVPWPATGVARSARS